jgi:signal transduction histidine kinase
MHAPSRWLNAARRHAYRLNTGIAVHVFTVTVLITAYGPQGWRGHLVGLAIPAALLACAPLVVRHRWPVPVLVVTAIGAETYMALTQSAEVILAAPLIALYTVADTTGNRRPLTIGISTVLVLSLAHAVIRPTSMFWPGNIALAALGGLAVAAGDATRSRRAFLAATEERARNAELGREEEARRRVTDERLRIARDLHDELGHHIALINLQAGVAAHVLTDQPDQARQALVHIKQASKAALADLRDTIGLLRQPGETATPTEPPAGLAALPGLLNSFQQAGLRIAYEVEGTERPVPATADLTAYRVIQESLTNVRKHAGKTNARLRLGYHPATLSIVVDNDSVFTKDNGTGHGITGMRERVAAIGGSMHAGPRSDGGFRVTATLPVPQQAAT